VRPADPAKPAVNLRDRFIHAQLEYGQWRRESALLLMIACTTETARRRYPHLTEADAFARFVSDEMHNITLASAERVDVEFEGKSLPLGEFLWLLATLRAAADRRLPFATDFHADAVTWLRVTPTEVTLPDHLIEGLATAVALAPENEAEFPPDPTDGGD